MTDSPLQGFRRFIAIDIHKHELMIGGIDAHQQIGLRLRNPRCWAAFRSTAQHSMPALSQTLSAQRDRYLLSGMVPPLWRGKMV